jgi:hypothetical protein
MVPKWGVPLSDGINRFADTGHGPIVQKLPYWPATLVTPTAVATGLKWLFGNPIG